MRLHVSTRLAAGSNRSAWARWCIAVAACWAALACAPAARATDSETGAPAARVGQVAQVSSNARMRVARAAAWEPAALNTPLTTGSALATESSASGEVRVGSTVLHLAPETQVVFGELNDNALQMETVGGMVVLRVRALPAGERVLLTAGAVALQVQKPGLYRLRHTGSGTRVVVWVQEGQARLTLGAAATPATGAAPGTATAPITAPLTAPTTAPISAPTTAQDLTLGPNQHAVLERKTAALLSTGASDERRPFDGVVEIRERRSESSFALLNLPAEMTGAESLDGHGSWRQEAGHGAVWFPDALPVDWAPYRFGRWRWLAPWGWTWLDDAPWGFAPFHYGRWLFLGGRWGWVPGLPGAAAPAARPVFAPALVGFYGSAASAVWTPTATAAPVVGWYPLAPGETYWPAYSTQLAYVRALNAASVGDAAQIQALPAANAAGPAHRYARTSFAATAVPPAAFSSGQPVASHQVPLTPLALAQAPLTGRRLPPPRP